MSYAAGFSDGERDSFNDRQNGIRRVFQGEEIGEYQRGYSDGYSARNSEWAARPPKTGAAWWVERESVTE